MSIKFDLKQFKREYEARHQRDVTWAEIREKTGIPDSTLNRLLNQDPQRVDFRVMDKLCEFFEVEAGPVPFLFYIPNNEEDSSSQEQAE